jgi:putative FmdB family regulatory protein
VLYRFKCDKCEIWFDEFSKWEDIKKVKCPTCKGTVDRVFTSPCLITDTSFALTGEYDKRLGSVVEGRSDFKKKIKEKGFCELSTHDIRNMD